MRNTVLALGIAPQLGNRLVICKGMHNWSEAAGRQFMNWMPRPTAEL